MKYPPAADPVTTHIELSGTSPGAKPRPSAGVSLLTPLDPLRQAKRLPIRLIKMLTAHTGHLLHPDYLQPLTSAPVSIEVLLNAKILQHLGANVKIDDLYLLLEHVIIIYNHEMISW